MYILMLGVGEGMYRMVGRLVLVVRTGRRREGGAVIYGVGGEMRSL